MQVFHRVQLVNIDTPRDLVTSAGLLFEAAYYTERALADEVEVATGLTRPSVEVLLRLGRTPGGATRMSDLAAQVLMPPSSFSRLADKLEDAGLVRRAPDPAHRRATLLHLTTLGENRLNAVQAVQGPALVARFSDLFTEEEIDSLESMMRRLRAANAAGKAFDG